ncbi:MAG: hypothetical protein O6934_09190, partial [SAR324 cluster bacterium]|nr:hypothetical protein [SAR324 cluster bacterium]
MAQRDSEKKVSDRDKNNGGEDRHFAYVRTKAQAAQQASRHLVGLSTVQKNEALEAISSELERSIDGI